MIITFLVPSRFVCLFLSVLFSTLSCSFFSLLYVEFYEYILVIVSAVASFLSQRPGWMPRKLKDLLSVEHKSTADREQRGRQRETECLESTPIIDWTCEVCLDVRRHSASFSSASIKGGRKNKRHSLSLALNVQQRRSLPWSLNCRKYTKVRWRVLSLVCRTSVPGFRQSLRDLVRHEWQLPCHRIWTTTRNSVSSLLRTLSRGRRWNSLSTSPLMIGQLFLGKAASVSETLSPGAMNMTRD